MSKASSQTSGWQLGGDGPLAYDTYIVAAFMQGYSRRLVEAAAIDSGNRVLDVACGTGVVTRLAANMVGSEGCVVGRSRRDLVPHFFRCAAERRSNTPARP